MNYNTTSSKIEINCATRCLNGKAPAEHDVDIMLRQLTAYSEAKYPNAVVTSERYYWDNVGLSDDFNFAIFRSLK